MPDSPTRIIVAVTAKNEAAAIGSCLRSLLASVREAEVRLPLAFRVVVILDDCTDATGEIARSFGVETKVSTGGPVEAISPRRGFILF